MPWLDPEKRRANRTTWSEERRAYYRAYQRVYKKERRQINPGFESASKKKWVEANPEAYREIQQRAIERSLTEPKAWARRKLALLKFRCQRKEIPFDLTLDELISALPVDGICPVLGVPLKFERRAKRFAADRDSPSVDRIIPERGYVTGNISIISHKANSMKQECIDPAEFRRLADWLESQLKLQSVTKSDAS